ncbi:MAG: bifunctional tRNA threonylcarbamoyladenosine biosynthesis protein [archaeon GW2011_AR3]|nr:MAG: bifunctional tRNA threonylcarbamoyladenosine biosynthesis protein [archaeon GW2011_AR3]MBS3108966.1 Kae1-associated serine/threonine protein kinase [Candidatus Woesearchaeota archaeon]
MDILAKGAEATIIRDNETVRKNREKKSYRLSQIDDRLRSARTKKEANILRKLQSSSFPSPKIISSTPESGMLVMEHIPGPKIRDILENSDYTSIAREIGERVARLHNMGIIHGDLTTSNMILKQGHVYFLDFGLSYTSERVEDRAVDLHLFRQALESKHHTIWQKAFAAFGDSYSRHAGRAREILARFEIVEMRGRYKQKGS